MSQFVNGAVIGVVAFVALVSAFWFTSEIQHEEEIAFGGMSQGWGSGGTQPDWRLSFTFHNPHRSYVELMGLQYDVELNGRHLTSGERELSVRIAPESNRSVEIRAELPADFASTWLSSHSAAGERTHLHVRGNATFMVLQRPVVVPFSSEEEWTAPLAGDLLAPPCAAPENPCLGAPSLAWDDAAAPTLRLRLAATNTNGTLLWLRNLSAQLMFNGQPVASSVAPAAPIELSSHTVREAELILRFAPDALARWWPAHAALCEQSPTGITVSYHRERWLNSTHDSNATINATESSGVTIVAEEVSWTATGPTFETHFACRRT